MRKTNFEKIEDVAEKIAVLSHQLKKLAEKEYGENAYVFVSDDEGIAICKRDESNRSQSARNEIVQMTESSHAFDIGSW